MYKMPRIWLIIIAALVFIVSICIHCAISTEMFVSPPALHDDWTKVPSSSFFNVSGTPCDTQFGDSRLAVSEMTNAEFTKLFQETFKPTGNQNALPADIKEIKPTPNPVSIINWIRVQIKNIHENYQVISWHLNKAYTTETDAVLFDLDLVIYRIPAYHGKHVRMMVKQGPRDPQPIVLSAKLIGETPADRILFHPLEQYDPIMMSDNASPTASQFTLPSLSETEVNELVRRQQEKIKLR